MSDYTKSSATVTQAYYRAKNPELKRKYSDEVIRDKSSSPLSSAGLKACSSCSLRFSGCVVIRDYDRAIVSPNYGGWSREAKCVSFASKIIDEEISNYCKEVYVSLDKEFRTIHGDYF